MVKPQEAEESKMSKQESQRKGLHIVLLVAMLATTFLPSGGAAARPISPQVNVPSRAMRGENSKGASMSVDSQGRSDTPTPTDSPRETPTDTLVPRYTDTPIPPPPRRATPTPTRPFVLPTPTATSPVVTEESAPPPFVPYSGTNTLTILGCDPPADKVKLTFRRIYANIQGSGEVIPVAVQHGGQTGLFVFDLPPAEPGALFALDLHINSAECPTGDESGIDNWTPGSSIHATFALPGGTSLLASSLGKKIPNSQQGEVYVGGVWSVDIEFSTTPKGHIQTFKWSTLPPGVVSGKLQASLLPFPSTTEGDLLNPPGLIVDWDVTCGDCTFSVDVSSLAYDPPQSSQPASQGKVITFFKDAWQGFIQFFKQAADLVQAFFGKQQPASQQPPVMTGAVTQPDNAINLVDQGKIVPPLITTFYFRVVPLLDGKVAGPASNSVRIEWYGEDTMAEVIKKGQECQQNPGAPGCPTPVPPPLKPYIVEIVGYHGFIAPKNGHEGCYIVTKNTVVKWGGSQLLYKAGQKLCPPKPKDKSWYEAVVDFVVDAVNWVSEAYNDLKDTVVDIVANFVPAALCSKACLGTLLDAGLMALGIPPSIPNFDQLMNEGLDYLASQAAAQLGVPKEVYDSIDPSLTGVALQLAISQAEDAWKAEAEKQIKQGLQKGLEAAQYALSESVSFVPDGVPIKPDPFGDYQPPTLTLKITRDPNIPPEADACAGKTGSFGNLWMLSTVMVSDDHAQNFNDWISSIKQKMQANYAYYLYESKYVPLPKLALGETQIVPVVLRPTFYDYWGAPWTSFNDSQKAWSTWYWNGQMNLSVSNPCTKGASVLGDPNQSFGP